MEEKQIKTDYLVTGAAGFIGFYLTKRLLELGYTVVGVDNLNDYYQVDLKYARLEQLKAFTNFEFLKRDISDKDIVMEIFKIYNPMVVINLAAQAGVQYSLVAPDTYIQSNVIGFYHILEACRKHPIKHLIYASSSSVYGANRKVPFEESDTVDHPVSLYAATKKTNEIMAETYSHLYKIPMTGLRFFTVYGPFGRPDMAYFSFTDHYFNNKPIHIYNNGDYDNDLFRDFTYIDDIVGGIEQIIHHVPEAPSLHKIYNIGNNKPEKLMTFIETLERCLSKATGREILFHKVFEPMKPGDVPTTYASTKLLAEAFGFKPKTTIEEGLQRFADWYVEYYKIS